MRIAYVLSSLGVGGAEKQVVALAERMTRRGHAAALVVLRPAAAQEWPTSLEVLRPGMRKTSSSIIAGLFRTNRELSRFGPDLIHAHTYPGNMVARTLRLLRATPPVVSTVHNVYEGGSLRMLAYRLTDRASVLTTAVSHAAANRYMRLKAVPAAKCRVLVNGIDVAEFRPDPLRRAALRVEIGVVKEFVWLASGRIAPAKDYPNLLRAFALVGRSHPLARLWIAADLACAEAAGMQRLAEESGLKERVRWLGLRRDLPALLDAADGFVLASAWEGMPLAAGEAMAMEKPVVATDVGGVSELLGDAGELVPAHRPEELARAMVSVMSRTPKALFDIGRAGRRRICAGFSMEAAADKWEDLYRSALAGKT